MISVSFFHVSIVNYWGKFSRGGVLARFYRPRVGSFDLFLLGDGELAHQKNFPRFCPRGGGGVVRLGIDWYITQERLKQWQLRLIILFTVKQALRAGWYEQAYIKFLTKDMQTKHIHYVNPRSPDMIKPNYRSFNFFSKNRKIDNEKLLIWD